MEVKELEELYNQGKYRELIKTVGDIKHLDPAGLIDAEIFFQAGRAHYQLGEYEKAKIIMEKLRTLWPSAEKIGDSARRILAHCFLQGESDINAADSLLREIPESPDRDNLRMNLMIVAARKRLAIPAEEVVEMAINALSSVSITTVDGHIVNNGSFVLYEARDQETTKPYLRHMFFFIFAAINIYKVTGAAKNHIAGAEFRASKICEAMGKLDIAHAAAQRSVDLWRELVNSQDGERYQQNLEGAVAQLKKLTL